MKVSIGGDMKELKELLALGINVNIQDEYGWTALMKASSNGYTETLEN